MNGGVGFVGLLFLLFLGLKLGGIINWSWFWIFSPLIFSIGLVILVLIIFLLFIVFKG